MSARTRGIARGLALAGAVTLGCAGALVACSGEQPSQPKSEQSRGSSIGGAFALTDVAGRPLTDQRLRGKPYAIFFGFTRCPDVCPTAMSRMAQIHRALGADAGKLEMVFVSVDPEHDKADNIAGFLSMFPVPVIGATGTPQQIAALTETFKLYVKKVPLPSGDYTVDHTTAIYLMDRDGRFFEPMSANEPLDTNLAQIRRLLAA